MSNHYRAEPANSHQFRLNTQKRDGKMVCVTTTPKKCRCVRCDKHRTEATGKHTNAGFICHSCRRV